MILFLELMVDLHESIIQLGRHFMTHDQNFLNVSLEPDFSIESHSKDHDRFNHGNVSGVKRGKALLGSFPISRLHVLCFSFFCAINRVI